MIDPYEAGKVCGARVYCARLCDAMNTSGFGASDEAIARGEGLKLPACYLPRNHEGPHMLDPVMWEPPEPPLSREQRLETTLDELLTALKMYFDVEGPALDELHFTDHGDNLNAAIVHARRDLDG